MRIAVYGLGRLGLPLATVLGSAGHEVIGVDPRVHDVVPGRSQHEPDVVVSRVQVLTISAQMADMSFVIVPTPSLSSGDHHGGFDSRYVEDALRNIAKANVEGHPAVIVSTVSPGTCDRLAKDFPTLSIVYNPTFIALGNVVEGLTDPELLLLGGDPFVCALAREVWQSVFEVFDTESSRTVHLGSYTEIELIKLSVNAALGTKISLANSLGELFEAWGVDRKAVEIVGLDSRIGQAYFTPGGPITGPCLPRDNTALQVAATEKGLALPISLATDRVNWNLLHDLRDRVLNHNPRDVGILGMTYKYGVDVSTAAVGPWLRSALESRTVVQVHTYDDLLGGDLDAVLAADVIVVTQREYRSRLYDDVRPIVEVW